MCLVQTSLFYAFISFFFTPLFLFLFWGFLLIFFNKYFEINKLGVNPSFYVNIKLLVLMVMQLNLKTFLECDCNNSKPGAKDKAQLLLLCVKKKSNCVICLIYISMRQHVITIYKYTHSTVIHFCRCSLSRLYFSSRSIFAK